jgi:hypothetical protein
VEYGFAQNIYVIQRGDTFSHIVKRYFPSGHLYGPKGNMAIVLAQNPHIKNPNRIYPQQTVTLLVENATPVAETMAPAIEEIKPAIHAAKEKAPESAPQNRDVSFESVLEEWNISALYGAKYLSLSQSGALGSADVGVLFLNELKLKSEFLLENWSFGFQLASYQFKYESLTSGDSKRMYALDLYTSYKWAIGGLGVEENPLFRNDGGDVQMTKQSLMYLSLGVKKDIELPTRKPTKLKLKTLVHYPLSSNTDNADVELKSVSGFGVQGQIELNRQIFAKEDYSLHATWVTDIGYRKISQDVEWDVSSGKAESNMTSVSTSLGLLFKF